jgi:glycosyltransferase involved in cell wall biosynthesis
MSPRVSAILATYDGERFVRRTIESVLAQDHADLELVVCDDGSRDGTREVLRSFGSRLVLVEQRNSGVSAARNAAAARATGEFYAFVDQDDLWEPNRVSAQLELFAREPGLGFAYADSWIVDGEGVVTGRRREHLDYRRGRAFDALLEGNFVPIETLLVPAAVFREVGGFDPRVRYLEDWELCLRIARRYPIDYVPQPLARYRIHDANMSWNMEAILGEYAQLLAALPEAMPDLDQAERAHVARVVRRRHAELAWYAVKRRDFELARRWLAQARPVRPRGLGLKIAVFGALLRALPKPLATSLGHALERRGLFGSVRS